VTDAAGARELLAALEDDATFDDLRAVVAGLLRDVAGRSGDARLIQCAKVLLAPTSPGRPTIAGDADVLDEIKAMVARGVPRRIAVATVARAVGADASTIWRWRRKLRKELGTE
jgi:hypothetical protein